MHGAAIAPLSPTHEELRKNRAEGNDRCSVVPIGSQMTSSKTMNAPIAAIALGAATCIAASKPTMQESNPPFTLTICVNSPSPTQDDTNDKTVSISGSGVMSRR